ncbi:MAG TPA: hypothetical protein VK470_14160 [Bacteroidota bacterium]|nr:hypothetical protein [Bacteroidota bacterium]
MGQTFLVLSAMMLLSLVVLQANGLILSKYSETYDMQATHEAVSLAEDRLDQATRKSFDEKALTKKIYNASEFTSVANLGPDPYESGIPQFDDLDDYDNTTETFSTPTVDNFTIVYTVDYVTVADPDAVSAVPTFFKRVKVSITNPSMSHAVVSSRVVVYRRYQ